MKAKVKSYKLPEGTNIAFWRWITPNTIAMVTQTAVMHWTMDGDSAPVKVFDRHGSLANSQIINYQASADGKWLLLVGISQGANSSINGNMQLYSVDKRVSQPLQGHAGCFASVHVNNEATARNVFCFIEKKPQQQPKLFVMQVGQGGEGSPFKIPPQPVTFAPEAANDFPVSLIVSRKHDILFLITKARSFPTSLACCCPPHVRAHTRLSLATYSTNVAKPAHRSFAVWLPVFVRRAHGADHIPQPHKRGHYLCDMPERRPQRLAWHYCP